MVLFIQNLQNFQNFVPKISKRVYTAIRHLRVGGNFSWKKGPYLAKKGPREHGVSGVSWPRWLFKIVIWKCNKKWFFQIWRVIFWKISGFWPPWLLVLARSLWPNDHKGGNFKYRIQYYMSFYNNQRLKYA